MTWSEDLSGPHLQIAGSDSSRIGVLAGPGTGKTSYGLMRRVARLLEEGVPPEEILLISFTRTAAHDLRTKVANLGVEGAEEVRATTLHAYCFGLLQRDAVLVITGRTPRPLLDHELDMMLRDISGDFGTLAERRQRLRAYEAGWVRQASAHPGLAEPEDDEFGRNVLRWLRRHKAMLVGEVVPIASAYLRDNPMAEERGRYRHVVVDEYQDLNSLEQHLLDLIAEDANLCIAGDDDQSIYGFRYANPEGILAFRERNGVERIEIETCGRCAEPILNIANELIAHAPGRTKPELMAGATIEGTVSVIQWADLEEEVEGVTAAIAADVERERREPGDILILVHRQQIGEMIRRRLVELGVPAHSFFSQESLKFDEARRALAILRMAVGEDRASIRVICGVGDGQARADAYRRLSVYCHEVGKTQQEVLDELLNGASLPVRVPAILKLYESATAVVRAVQEEELADAVERLFPPDVQELADLRDIALEEALEAEDVADLSDRIVRRVTQHDVPETPDFVRIMSLHKSKGLTSRVVYIATMVDGVVPTVPARLNAAEADAARDEQRRLTFVAITRAAEELVISSATRMELGLASSLGVRVVRERIRRIGEHLVAPTIASPYLDEMKTTAPGAIRGVGWLSQKLG